ncbi:hypothetical protein NHJ6243_009984 [Beauveria neobassiana]
MVLVEHTFDAKCRQTPVNLPDRDGGMPPVKAQFFYSSSVPIDDPLSVSSHTATTDFKKYKELLRPFGRGDNNALETAWVSLSNTESRSRHEALRSGKPKTGSVANKDASSREELVQKAAQKHGKIHLEVKHDQNLTARIAASTNEMRDTQEELCCSELLNEIKEQLKHTTCSLARAVDPLFRPEAIATDVSALIRRRQLQQDSEECPILNSLQSESSNKNSRTIDVGSLSRPSTPKQFFVDDMRSFGKSQSKRSSWTGEAGYQEMKPWTETWKEELACALEVGAAGEEKVSYQLWPEHNRPLNGINSCDSEPIISSDLFCAARCFRGDAAANGSIYSLNMEKQLPNRPFARYQVIYKDRKTAFLLKPNLAPSSYHGRCPVAKILRGLTVGLPVVRGFDRRSWNRLQGPKKAAVTAEEVPAVNAQEEISSECPACSAEKDRGQITDLVLVAHGIGQKIAERVESYHFTHAINSFRRAVNIELGNPTIQNVLRADQNGFMILPLNWRVGLSFDSDDATPTGTKDTTGSFDLKDIEPSTIPAVRSMISDVMFDIPFYMSHHKIKMITALVREANRVYRLWCRNNPGFSDKGRVHLIAHSLGSVMAVDILSRQPTSVPRLNLCTPIAPDDQHFEFNTTNLFLAGSPAGFFLLLEKGALMPRCGRTKAGADDGDVVAKNVVGEAGTFGCLAVDNVYNVLAKEDPIAYLLTGAIDPSYSSSLKVAYVPSVTPSLISTVRDAIRQVVPGLNPEPDPLAIEPQRPTTARMPSQLELEIHDFTREEIAEKKAYLLNDNGQIDWFLRSSGGPLEIQYLNMLSAHTSYWTNQDFIRMVCLEIGRKPGRSHTFPAMRAVKKTKRDGKK